MRPLRGAFILTLLPALAGCFDYEQTFIISQDGQLTLVTELAIDAQMIAMAIDDAEGGCPVDPPAVLPEGFTAHQETLLSDGDSLCILTYEGPLDGYISAFEMSVLIPTNGEDGAPQLRLAKEGNGVYRLEMRFHGQGGAGPEEGAGPDPAMLAAMLAALFEGRQLTWSVMAPKILETNGVMSGNTATFTIPALDVATQTDATYEFFVRFSLVED